MRLALLALLVSACSAPCPPAIDAAPIAGPYVYVVGTIDDHRDTAPGFLELLAVDGAVRHPTVPCGPGHDARPYRPGDLACWSGAVGDVVDDQDSPVGVSYVGHLVGP